MHFYQASARDRDYVQEIFESRESPEQLSPGIPRPINPGPGPSHGSRILEFRVSVPVPDPGFSDLSPSPTPGISGGFRKSRLSHISGTETAGSRGSCPGCRPLISTKRTATKVLKWLSNSSHRNKCFSYNRKISAKNSEDSNLYLSFKNERVFHLRLC